MKRLRTLAVLLPAYAVVVSWSLLAQGQARRQAPASYSADPMIQSLKWRNVGNANLIGRISRSTRSRFRARHRRERVGRRIQINQRRRHLDADLR